MFTDLKPYPEYADSGITWLGQLPAHWHVNRLGQIGTFLKGSGGSREDDMAAGVPCVRYGDVYKYHNAFVLRAHSFVSEEQSAGYTRLRRGDLLFALSGESQAEIGKSAVNLINGRAVCGGDLAIFRANAPIDSRFLGYVADAYPSVAQKSRMGRGDIVVHVSAGRLKRLCIGLPSIDEQAEIVKYLGHANARIDRAIAAKRKLISLLGEQQKALFSRVVTRGLDDTVPLRDSGIPWLGEIPDHWKACRARYVFREVDLKSVDGSELALSMSQQLGLVPSNQMARSLTAESMVGGRICEPGDLVLNRLKAHLGVFAVSRFKGVISPDYTIFRGSRDIDSRYFEIVLRSELMRPELRTRSKGIVEGFWRLYTDDFNDIGLPFPPLTEQHEIVDALKSQTSGMQRMTARTSLEIDLLREFRARLTADVVTGQLDVRQAAACLPELDYPTDFVIDVVEPDDVDLDAEAADYLKGVDA